MPNCTLKNTRRTTAVNTAVLAAISPRSSHRRCRDRAGCIGLEAEVEPSGRGGDRGEHDAADGDRGDQHEPGPGDAAVELAAVIGPCGVQPGDECREESGGGHGILRSWVWGRVGSGE